jgi:hypothetical protein
LIVEVETEDKEIENKKTEDSSGDDDKSLSKNKVKKKMTNLKSYETLEKELKLLHKKT